MGFQRLACRVWIFALRNSCERDKAQIETKRGNSVSKIIKQSGRRQSRETLWPGWWRTMWGPVASISVSWYSKYLNFDPVCLGWGATDTLRASWAPGGTWCWMLVRVPPPNFLGVSDERMCTAVAPALCLGGLGSRYPQNLRWGHVVSGECPGFAPGPSYCPTVDQA